MNILELSEQEIGRRQSLQQLRDMGINPYPAAEYPVTNWSEDIKANFHDDEKARRDHRRSHDEPPRHGQGQFH